MVYDTGIFKYKQFVFFPCFTFIPETDMGLPKQGLMFTQVCGNLPGLF